MAAPPPAPDTPDSSILQQLERITVTATLNERASKDVANEVSIIDAAEIDRRAVQDIADLIRYEPGVSVTGDPTRFGLGGFRIRGLDEDRVRIELDGVPVPQAFAIGSYANSARDFVDVDALKQVEIIRGASSSLYGSDALGGVVSFISKDPLDYLGADGGLFLSGKLLHATVNDQTSVSGTVAAGNARHGFMLVATDRRGHETDNQGEIDSADSSRTRPNPQETESQAVLAKYVHTSGNGRTDRLTLDFDQGDVETDVLSARTLAANGPRTTDLRADDDRRRQRIGFEQSFDFANGPFDHLEWKLWNQESRSRQETWQERYTATAGELSNPNLRFRHFDFEQEATGAGLVARKSVQGANIAHDLTFGLDFSRTRTEELRTGYQLDLTTGVSTPVVMPDVFPVRDFPITDTRTAAVFAQDEMRLLDGRLSLLPSVRVDRYRLDPDSDAIYAEDNPGIEPQGLSLTHTSPRFGAIWRFDDTWSAFAQYAQGFRAPPFDDVNLGFTNFAFGYTALPNPDLKPERSRGFELGLRASGQLGYFSLAAYQNHYRDFIESLAFVGFTEEGLMIFQSRNLNEVEIRGVEARYGLELGAWNPALEGWTVKGNFAIARGDDETADQPLTSIDPRKAVIGIAYDRPRWGVELMNTFVARKDRLPSGDPDQGIAAPFEAPGYGRLDFYAHWQLSERIETFAALTNLTDRHYWDWGIAQGLSASSAVLDRFSAPGRAAAFGVRANF